MFSVYIESVDGVERMAHDLAFEDAIGLVDVLVKMQERMYKCHYTYVCEDDEMGSCKVYYKDNDGNKLTVSIVSK